MYYTSNTSYHNVNNEHEQDTHTQTNKHMTINTTTKYEETGEEQNDHPCPCLQRPVAESHAQGAGGDRLRQYSAPAFRRSDFRHRVLFRLPVAPAPLLSQAAATGFSYSRSEETRIVLETGCTLRVHVVFFRWAKLMGEFKRGMREVFAQLNHATTCST